MSKEYNWQEIQKYYDEGHNRNELREKFGCYQAIVEKAIKEGKFVTRTRTEGLAMSYKVGNNKNGKQFDWKEIQKYYDGGHTIVELKEKFGCSGGAVMYAKEKGIFRTRTNSESFRVPTRVFPKSTVEQRKKISNAMKKAHAEGRAYCISRNMPSKKQSYPEKFFTGIIEREFVDKNYKPELPFHRYSLDFAWIEKKRVIEIDGMQHILDPKQVESDKRKDALLKEEGWQLLRIKWKDMCNETQKWIDEAKRFIDGKNNGVSYNGITQDSGS